MKLDGKVVSDYFSSSRAPTQRWRIEVEPMESDNYVHFVLRRELVEGEVGYSEIAQSVKTIKFLRQRIKSCRSQLVST